MTTIATGVGKQVRYAKETTFGTPATAGGTSQLVRRVTSGINLTKDTYKSSEIRPDYQINDYRHGHHKVAGPISGELSPKTWKDFLSGALMQAWVTESTTGALSTVTAASTGATTGTFTRDAGSFLTDGFRIGDVVRQTGWTTTGTANNNVNYRITALSALVMTVSGVVVSKAEGDAVTTVTPGSKLMAPLSGQTNDSFTIEHWFSDVSRSEVYSGCRVSQVDLKMPATGIATIDFAFMGQDRQPAGSSAYFTTPTAATTTTVLTAVNGLVRVGGTDIGTMTSLTLSIKRSMTEGSVVGSNVTPDVFRGPVDVSGQFTAYFADGELSDDFVNESEIGLWALMNTNSTANTDFVALTMNRIKLGSDSVDDGVKGLVRTYSFQALLQSANSAMDATTISIQDSLA
jgi:hypothetical protein